MYNRTVAQTSQDTLSYRHNVSPKAMCCICTLQHCTQLGVSNSCLFACGTDRPCRQEQYHDVTSSIMHSLPSPFHNTQSTRSPPQCTIYPVPSTTHNLPGPMPTLMMSAPLSISSSTISPVTTLPAYTHQYMSPCSKLSHLHTYHDSVGWEIFPCLT